MFAELGADLLVLLHFGFILFVVFGGLLVLRWRKCLWLHLPAVVWGAWIEFSGGICPLTPLENYFRQQAGMQMYEGGFINQYITPIIYPRDLTSEHQFYMAMVLIVINVVVYGVVIYRYRRKGGV